MFSNAREPKLTCKHTRQDLLTFFIKRCVYHGVDSRKVLADGPRETKVHHLPVLIVTENEMKQSSDCQRFSSNMQKKNHLT